MVKSCVELISDNQSRKLDSNLAIGKVMILD